MSPVADRCDNVSPRRIPLEVSGLSVLGSSDESELARVIELQLTVHPDIVCAQFMHRNAIAIIIMLHVHNHRVGRLYKYGWPGHSHICNTKQKS